MSIVDFLNCISEPLPIEVNVFHGSSVRCTGVGTYVGSPTNWDAFKTHLSGFTKSEVFNVSVKDGKLIVDSTL